MKEFTKYLVHVCGVTLDNVTMVTVIDDDIYSKACYADTCHEVRAHKHALLRSLC